MTIYLVKEIIEEYEYMDYEGWLLTGTKSNDIMVCDTEKLAEKEALKYADDITSAKIKLHSANNSITVDALGYDKNWLYDHNGMFFLTVYYGNYIKKCHHIAIQKIMYKTEGA